MAEVERVSAPGRGASTPERVDDVWHLAVAFLTTAIAVQRPVGSWAW